LNKILNKYSNSVALDGNPEPEPDLVHATGCKQPSLRLFNHAVSISKLCVSSDYADGQEESE
jgi:hypothetical protein